MAAYGIPGRGGTIAPRAASDNDLMLVHSSGYIEVVRESGDWGTGLHAGMGLGTEDNPIYPGMHDIAALTCGGSMAALDEVLSGRHTRTFSIAGGMHHAHRSRAAGFSVYNDAAVAIAVARRAARRVEPSKPHPGLAHPVARAGFSPRPAPPETSCNRTRNRTRKWHRHFRPAPARPCARSSPITCANSRGRPTAARSLKHGGDPRRQRLPTRSTIRDPAVSAAPTTWSML
jgi:hypothetical protein